MLTGWFWHRRKRQGLHTDWPESDKIPGNNTAAAPGHSGPHWGEAAATGQGRPQAAGRGQRSSVLVLLQPGSPMPADRD